MTKKEMFEMAINVIAETTAPEKDELITGLEHEIELLSRRKSSPKGMTKTQKANENVKEAIVACLADNGMMRAMDVASELGITIQKASALLNQLVKAEVLEKVAEKKVNFFKVAEGA